LTTHLSALHPAQSVTIAAVAQIHLPEHLHRCRRRVFWCLRAVDPTSLKGVPNKVATRLIRSSNRLAFQLKRRKACDGWKTSNSRRCFSLNQKNAFIFAIARATSTNSFAWVRKWERISSYELVSTDWRVMAAIGVRFDRLANARRAIRQRSSFRAPAARSSPRTSSADCITSIGTQHNGRHFCALHRDMPLGSS
jgi:hypothetical protein